MNLYKAFQVKRVVEKGIKALNSVRQSIEAKFLLLTPVEDVSDSSQTIRMKRHMVANNDSSFVRIHSRDRIRWGLTKTVDNGQRIEGARCRWILLTVQLRRPFLYFASMVKCDRIAC